MFIDRYTKSVPTLIAIGLFVISLNPWIAPINAYAELDTKDYKMFREELRSITASIRSINCN